MAGLLQWLFHRKRYQTEWIDDLPASPRTDTIYVVGGREHPYRVVMACPDSHCNHLVYLDVYPGAKPGWRMTEHRDGSLSLRPSVFLTGMPCRAHYWVGRGRVIWTPPAWIYRMRRRSRRRRANARIADGQD